MQSLIHSTACWRQVGALQNAAAGDRGDDVRKRLGNPWTCIPMAVRRSRYQSSRSERDSRPRMSICETAPVAASNPVAKMMMSKRYSRAAVRMGVSA